MSGLSYWITGTVSGKRIFAGPYQTEGDAYKKASNIKDWDNDFEIVKLGTRDMARAKAMYKEKLAGSTGMMGNALLRIGSADKHLEKQQKQYEI